MKALVHSVHGPGGGYRLGKDRAQVSVADIIIAVDEPVDSTQCGGCSGFQHGFTFDEVTNEDDTVLNKNGVQLLIDPMSLQYLVGAEIDYQDGLEGSQFVTSPPP